MTSQKLAAILWEIALIRQIQKEVTACSYLIQDALEYGMKTVAEKILLSDVHEFRLDGEGFKLVWREADGAKGIEMNVYDEGSRYPVASQRIKVLLKKAGLLRLGTKQIACDDVAFLHVLGGKPNTEEGKRRLNEHYNTHRGEDCYQASSLIGTLIDRTPENRMYCEEVFGLCDWS